MNTRPYEYLLAISENGSLSKAAQALGISQPTLSNFLSGTERQMGHALFERSGRVLIPTEAGLIYLDTCRRILEVISQTYHAIASLEDRYREAFTVGVTPYRGSQVFSEIFPEFYHKFPDIKIDLVEGYMGAMWGDQTTNSRITKSFLARNDITPTVVYESNNALLINGMLRAGIGVGFLPASFCLPGQERVYFSITPPLRSLVGVFFSKDHVLTKAQRYFIYLITRLQAKSSQNGSTYLNETAKKILREFEKG